MEIQRKVIMMCYFQIHQSQNNQFNMHVHVEYEWRLRQDDLYESDDDLDDKVTKYADYTSQNKLTYMLTEHNT